MSTWRGRQKPGISEELFWIGAVSKSSSTTQLPTLDFQLGKAIRIPEIPECSAAFHDEFESYRSLGGTLLCCHCYASGEHCEISK